MKPKFKYQVIYRHRTEYSLLSMCRIFGVSRSGYYDYVKRLGQPQKDAVLAEKPRAHQEHCLQTYGYRRTQFQSDRPNTKWVTDISYIQTKEGTLYLSMIRDLYDNSIRAYKTAARQTVNLVLDTIRLAMKKEKKAAAELQLHSDQGFQYTSQAYCNLTQEYGITPSMSRRGNPYDNAMAENFFSILKTERVYRHKPGSLQEADEMINAYIHFYNHERVQIKTGVAPLTLRHSA